MRYSLMATIVALSCTSLLLQRRGDAQELGFDARLDRASTIVVGRLDQFIAEPESMDRMVQEKARSSGSIVGGNVEFAVMSSAHPRGTYVFRVLSTLRGKSPQPLIVRLPRISSMSVGSSTRLPLKGRYLLFLSGSEANGFSPEYPTLILLSKQIDLPVIPVDETKPQAMVSALVRMFVASLEDPDARGAAARLLSNVVSEDAMTAMRKYLDDPDDSVRACAALCLATNQDVTVIPRLVQWKNTNPAAQGSPLAAAISRFKTPAAVPYLNPLLLDKTSSYVREETAQTLRKLPLDSSSIPFWMGALHDAEQQSVAYIAYECLHKLVPELGPGQGGAYFRANREEETRKLDAWWIEQQSKMPN